MMVFAIFGQALLGSGLVFSECEEMVVLYFEVLLLEVGNGGRGDCFSLFFFVREIWVGDRRVVLEEWCRMRG